VPTEPTATVHEQWNEEAGTAEKISSGECSLLLLSGRIPAIEIPA
jgi:hypothetical protein